MNLPSSKPISIDHNVGTAPTWGNGSMYRTVRRLIVFILGMSIVLIGIVMLVAPGPAFVVIPLGLAILATEFVWARRILRALKQRLVNTAGTDKSSRWHRFVTRASQLLPGHATNSSAHGSSKES